MHFAIITDSPAQLKKLEVDCEKCGDYFFSIAFRLAFGGSALHRSGGYGMIWRHQKLMCWVF